MTIKFPRALAAFAFFCAVLTITFLTSSTILKTQAAGTITGRVFQDFNGNGLYDTSGGTAASPAAVDTGLAGVTVSAYDGSGTLRGTATTLANGTYSLTATGTGPYRVEFTTLPAGYQNSARSTASALTATRSATTAGSSTQFVPDGTTANVNLAVNRPEEYCQNNPNLVTCRYNQGAQNGTFAANPALQNFAYNSGTVYTDTTLGNYDAPTTHSITLPSSAIGSVFGMAYSRLNNRIYAGAYYKRYVGFGPGANGTFDAPSTTSDDSSAIYMINPTTNAVVSTFTVPAAATNRHSTAAADDTTDASWNGVGKSGLGGLALTDDESRLFVMNLQNRTLYALDPATGTSLGSQLVPTPADCPTANDARPFAVKYYRGNVYVGMVCTGQSTALTSDLRAYVYQVDPATLAFGATPYTFSLNYNRGFANDGAANPAEWRPWVTTIQTNFSYPQAMLTDIEFDNGNMVLGFRDRYGDQGDDTSVRPGGDTIRVCGAFTAANFPGTLILEANGRCGGTGAAPQNTGQGPGAAPGTDAGSGEFYYQDDFSNPANGANYHDEVSLGGLTKIPGYNQTLTTVFDPISRIIGNGETFDGGVRWFNNTTGATDRAYRVFNGDGSAATTSGVFGKANGLGDIMQLCDKAPIEIGNRVWRDNNGDGVQTPGELGIANVTVRLYSGSTLIATAVTDANGEYYFSSATGTTTTSAIYGLNLLLNTAYQIRLDNQANFNSGGPLSGISLTTANQSTQAGFADGSDSDGVNVVNPAGSPASGVFPVITINTGAAGSNNHTYDFGFAAGPTAASVSVSGQVLDSRWKAIAGAKVTLTTQNGSSVSVTTNSFGKFTFNEVSGQSAVVTVSAKRYTFSQSSQYVGLTESTENMTFIANRTMTSDTPATSDR